MKSASTVAITEEEKMNDLGRIKKFKVTRTTKLGYMLTDGEKEYFLHRNESNYRDLQEGDGVEAFIYADKKGRLAATLYLPTATVERVDSEPSRCQRGIRSISKHRHLQGRFTFRG